MKGDPPDDFLLLAEVARHPAAIGRFLTATGFDAAYDFSFGIVREVLGQGEDLAKLSFVLDEAQRFYPVPRRMLAQIDNYEDPAFITVADEPKRSRMELALTLLLTIDRVPLIYSGDEVGRFYREVGGLFSGAGPEDAPTLAHTRRLIRLRRQEAALRRGDFAEVGSWGPVIAFTRTHGDERVLVILNTSEERRQVSFVVGTQPWHEMSLHDMIEERQVKRRGSPESLRIEPFGARLLKLE